MTQVISVITREYALLASDRRLTIAEGPRRGELSDDDTCKLVSLCNVCGIGYSGLARIAGAPTHEWIATTLASANCSDPGRASGVLAEEAGRALSNVPASIRYLMFVVVGWAEFVSDPPGLRSFLCWISNAFDDRGQALPTPGEAFHIMWHPLRDDEEIGWNCIGQSLRRERLRLLDRRLRGLAKREIGPREALRLLKEEIINTSAVEKVPEVGQRILGLCIPRASYHSMQGEGAPLLAKLPGRDLAAFTYFEPGYSELVQHGPTSICGENAMTDLRTESDPSGSQSVEVRILSLPRSKSLS